MPSGMDEMEERQNILVVEVEQLLFDRFAPVLQRRDFEVDRFPDAGRALELVSVVPFSAIIIGFPLREMRLEDFMDQILMGESASASIALLCSQQHTEAAERYKPLGVDLVLALENAPQEMLRLLCALLGVAPRSDLRVLVKLEIELTEAGNQRMMAQTEDISISGMLVSTPRLAPVGSQAAFTLTLPGEPETVCGMAEVARHTEPGADRVQGMGLKFVSFRNDGQECLRRYLDGQQNGTT
jgi:hypothetical protein